MVNVLIALSALSSFKRGTIKQKRAELNGVNRKRKGDKAEWRWEWGI
jgi:hypothetical protein